MKRKKLSSLLAAAVIIASLVTSVFAFADDVTWRYDSDTKTLYISGSGVMDNYEDTYSAPWNSYILEVQNVVIEEGVTSVGNYAFSGAAELKNVSVSDTVKTVGEFAFSSCPKLNYLYLPNSVNSIADASFAYNGVKSKEFTFSAPVGSYALGYMVNYNVSALESGANLVDLECDTVKCDSYTADIYKAGMLAVYPYCPKVNGTFTFYSTGTHDTVGYIYDSDFNLIATNDDKVGTNFGIDSVQLVKDETYLFCAKIYNSSLRGSFGVTLAPVEFEAKGSIFAMNTPNGDASNIIVDEALINGEATGGVYSLTYTAGEPLTVTAGHLTAEYALSPDEENIVLMMVDVNNDGKVNGKDYGKMLFENSKYISLFENFV